MSDKRGGMPVVFVHEVGTRTSPKYWSDVEMRKSLVRDFLFEPLGLPTSTSIEFAYWRDHTARFRWGHSVIYASVHALGSERGR